MSSSTLNRTLPPGPATGPAADPERARTLRERISYQVQRRGALAVLVLVGGLASGISPTFPTWSNISSILGNNAFVWLLALAMTFVITTGGIDLSVGSLYALGGVLAARGAQTGSGLAILLPVAVCAAWGAVQGLLVAKARMAPFIVTLAGLLGARGLLQALTNEGSTTYLVPQGSWFRNLGQGTWTPVLIVAMLFVLGWLLLERTGFGASLTAIAAVVIGGTLLTGGFGSVGGTLCGVLLLAVIHNLIDHYFSQYGSAFTDAVNGGFLAVVVLLQTALSRARRLG